MHCLFLSEKNLAGYFSLRCCNKNLTLHEIFITNDIKYLFTRNSDMSKDFRQNMYYALSCVPFSSNEKLATRYASYCFKILNPILLKYDLFSPEKSSHASIASCTF